MAQFNSYGQTPLRICDSAADGFLRAEGNDSGHEEEITPFPMPKLLFRSTEDSNVVIACDTNNYGEIEVKFSVYYV